jgi:hypothetical protein
MTLRGGSPAGARLGTVEIRWVMEIARLPRVQYPRKVVQREENRRRISGDSFLARSPHCTGESARERVKRRASHAIPADVLC